MAGFGAPLGNKHAAHDKPVLGAIQRALAQEDYKRLREGIEKVLDLYAAGDQWAIQWVTDRLEGKAKQSIDIAVPASEDDLNPVESARRIAFALGLADQAIAKAQET